jgi:hypothetical protein
MTKTMNHGDLAHGIEHLVRDYISTIRIAARAELKACVSWCESALIAMWQGERFTAPSPTWFHASSTAGAVVSLTRASPALSAPSDMRTPRSSQRRTTVLRRLTW